MLNWSELTDVSFERRYEGNLQKLRDKKPVGKTKLTYKSGKTRLWKEVTELHYPTDPNAALLIAWEPGFETWELPNVVNMIELASSEAERWAIFRKEIVPGLVKEAKEGRISRLIGTDTVDKCVDAASAWVIDQMSRKYGKQFTSLQEISEGSAGAANGWTLLYEELSRTFDALRNAGYGLLHLAWTKEKETTLYDGKKYNSIELMLHNTARKVFESQASFICCLHNEVTLLDKEGNVLEENLKTKSGKEIGTKFHETQVYMYFRPSQYISIAGGRFVNLPEKLEYSAENFLKVFEDAVKGQLKNPAKINEIREQEEQKREEKTQQYVQQEEEKAANKTPEELIQDITDTINNITNKESRIKAAEQIKSILGVAQATDYKKSTDPEKLQACLEAIKSL